MDSTSTQTPGPAPGETRTIPVISEHIGVRPGYCGGKPHILGHRIKVKHIAGWYEREGLSPSEIVRRNPTINLAQVHATLAYYYDHRAEVDEEFAEEDGLFADLRAKQPSILDKLRQRKGDAPDDPISSR